MTYSSEVLADSPVGYWKLNETSGAIAFDSSGNNRHASHFNNPRVGETPLKRAISDASCYYNGINQYSSIGYAPALQPIRLTLEAWVKRVSVPVAGVTIVGSFQFGGYGLEFQTGDVYVAGVVYIGGGYRYAYAPMAVGETAYIAFTWDGRYGKIYKNGVFVSQYDHGSNSNNIAYFYNNNNMIAANPAASGTTPDPGTYANMAAGHIAIYNTALPAARIAAHYAAAVRSLSVIISEELAADSFNISANRVSDGMLVGRVTSGSGAVIIEVDSAEPVIVTVVPEYQVWKASTVYAIDAKVFPTNPIAKPYYYKRLVAGASSATEPAWPTSPGSQCNDGAVTNAWGLVERLAQPITQGPLIPS